MTDEATNKSLADVNEEVDTESHQEEEQIQEEEEQVKSSPRIAWDPSDGLNWRDFVGLIILFFLLLWFIVKVILSPLLWIISQNIKMYKFVRADGQDRVMTAEEKRFIEEMPLRFVLTGISGGTILGVLLVISAISRITDFIDNLDLGDIFGDIGDGIATVSQAIWDAILWTGEIIVTGPIDLVGAISDTTGLQEIVIWLALVFLGVIAILVGLALVESGLFQKIYGGIAASLGLAQRAPGSIWGKLVRGYHAFNHKLTALLVGEERLRTRTQRFFKRSLIIVIILSLYSFGTGVFVLFAQNNEDTSAFLSIFYAALIFAMSGLAAGVLFFALIIRYFDLLSRKKYIASEFKTGEVVLDSIASDTDSGEDLNKEEDTSSSGSMADLIEDNEE